MKDIFTRAAVAAALVCAAALPATEARAEGWPAAYRGVMLQGFAWDSYSETNWGRLTERADELSKYFSLIWVPNSAKAEGDPTMGYHPIYWFTNHNSSFGTEAELRTMIKTYKDKGTGIIADVVINHRAGVSNWTDFPAETWNGKTYKMGPEGICSGDEVKNQSGQAKPTGGTDTGENWAAARDLDHTNANVQTNCRDYIKCLLTDFGYSGVRYDFVKGYAPVYNKMYNTANGVKFSVGEYWDGSYDAVAAWIEGTGRESAAFDFPFKYQLNKAFNGGAHKYTELCWKAGNADQPAGLIHFGYNRYAVTFVDNHDTYRDGSKYTGDVMLANAFMLCSPGTPCVFWKHYDSNRAAMQALINARNGVGITNTSAVKVLEVNDNCYVAEVTGTNGRLWVKLGNSSRTAGSGFTKKASGNGYEVWTTSSGEGPITPGPDVEAPASLYVIGEVDGNVWAPDKGVKMVKDGSKFTADVTTTDNSYFSFAVNLASGWDALNVAGNRFAPAADTDVAAGGSYPLSAAPSDAKAYHITAAGKYTLTVDWSAMQLHVAKYTGVEEIESGAESEAVYFNLQGIRVQNPGRGLYIRVAGGKVAKVLMDKY